MWGEDLWAGVCRASCICWVQTCGLSKRWVAKISQAKGTNLIKLWNETRTAWRKTELDETGSCLHVFTWEGCCEAKQIEDQSVGGVWRRCLHNVPGIETGVWCSAFLPAAGSRWYQLFTKKMFEQASVNTQKNKKGRNVGAWQKIEQQFHYKMHGIQVKIYHVLLIIGAECFLQWKCCQPFLNSAEENVR